MGIAALGVGAAGLAIGSADGQARIGSYSQINARLPVLWAAIRVEPLPPKRSRTMPLRPETSLMASAIIWTGFTVGWRLIRLIAPLYSVHSPIGPDIGPVTAMLAELKGVDVRRLAFLEGKDQLMPGVVECAHAAIVFDPDK